MKKLCSLLLALALLFSCTGCADNEDYYEKEEKEEAIKLKHEEANFWDIWETSGSIEILTCGEIWETEDFSLQMSTDSEMDTIQFDLLTKNATFKECYEDGDFHIEVFIAGDTQKMLFYDKMFFLDALMNFDGESVDEELEGNYHTADESFFSEDDPIAVLIITEGTVYKGVFFD